MQNNIIFKDVSVAYNDVIALEDITLKINKLEFTAVVGPNGAGKTTLAKTILGLIKPFKGYVSVFGLDPIKDRFKVRSLIGYVPQITRISHNIPITVLDTVLMSLLVSRKPPRYPSNTDIEAAYRALEIVDMIEYADKPFKDLSGGQKQRVLIARALVRNPEYLILDEPFIGVDVKGQCELINFLYEYHRRGRVGILIILHDITPLASLIDKVILLNKSIIASGPINEVFTPANLKRAYGADIEIIESGGVCYPIVRDKHG